MKEERGKPLAQEDLKTESGSSEEELRLIPLDRVEKNKKAKVIDIEGGWGVRRRLNQMGIHPGDVLTVMRHGALGGPIVIEVHGFQLALGRGIASQVVVEEVTE